jgi:hypothetical protein
MTIGGRGPGDPQPVVRRSGTVVGQAYSGLLAVRNAHQEHNEAVQRNAGNYSQDGLKAQLASFADTEAARSVDRIEQSVDQRVALDQAEVDQILWKLRTR